jgi:hypothetical protein
MGTADNKDILVERFRRDTHLSPMIARKGIAQGCKPRQLGLHCFDGCACHYRDMHGCRMRQYAYPLEDHQVPLHSWFVCGGGWGCLLPNLEYDYPINVGYKLFVTVQRSQGEVTQLCHFWALI